MSRTIQFRRLGASTVANTIGANGEIIINTTKKTLTVHDGSTPGGFALLSEATSSVDQFARDVANTATDIANTATGNITVLQGVDATQNTNIAITGGVAQNAYDKANAAFDYANTIVSDTQIDPVARDTANAAFNEANNVTIVAEAAFNQANSVYLPSVTRLNTINSGASAYLFDQYTGNNPDIFIRAGETIAFNLNVIGHPFLIRESVDGAPYSIGLTHVSTTGVVSTELSAQAQVSGTLYWKVPAELAGNTYVYQCQIHGGMVGNIVIEIPNQANSAINLAQAAYDYANTIVSDTQIDQYARDEANTASNNIVVLQGVNDTQNTDIANATNLAQAAFDQANTGGTANVTGNISIESTNSAINFVSNSSGDGQGYSTIELIPDTNATSNQYLIIDPTIPSHIHIRAGGTQDDSGAELFLGGENSYFKVSSGLNPPVAISSNQNVWTFNTDGTVFFPDFTSQTTAFTVNPTLDYTVTNNLKVESGIQVNYENIANATGTVTHNCANGQIFYHTTPSSNWTANFTNLQLVNGYSTTLTLVINQDATGYIANTILIDNSVTTIKWQGNTEPIPSNNSIDVLTFNLLKTGFNNGEVIILGQLTNFG
jgi:plastocyanin